MGLLSFLKRGDANETGESAAKTRASRSPRGGAESVDDVQQLRIQARRRLIGAAVLVGVAVIVFPLLFETQPRPIAVDLPIDIPRKDSATPLTIPQPPVRTAQAPTDAGTARGVITESAEDAASDRAVTSPLPSSPTPTPTPAEAAAQRAVPEPVEREVARPVERAAERPADKPAERKPEARPESKPAAKPETRPEARPEARPDARAEARGESARVQAMLDGRAAERKPEPTAPATGGRFIVQVGAYADSKAAQDVRGKVERLGLKTYTQAVDTADGKRIRVRVGPFASREEADRAAAKVRGGGLSSAVLTL